MAACANPQEFQGTYRQVAPLDDGREVAYELSLYRFGNEVGGVVRSYDLERPPLYENTLENPYLRQSRCDFFGPEQLSSNAVVFQADGPGSQIVGFELSGIDEDRISVRATRIGADEQVEGDPISFAVVRQSTVVDRRCQTASGFSVRASLPALPEDTMHPTVAVVFSAYGLTDGERRPRHTTATTVSVPTTAGGGEFSTEMDIVFPDPPDILSTANDPIQPNVRYALGYLVLFEDEDGAGEFRVGADDERVLAVSTDRVVLYVDGPPEELADSILAVLEDSPEEQPRGYGLHRVQLEVSQGRANVVSATLAGSTQVSLQPIDGEPMFPVLIPSETE